MAGVLLEKAGTTLLQLASFRLDGEEYGIDIGAVQEIVRMSTITRIPGSPEFVEGVVNLRGKVFPVIDLRRRFGLSSAEPGKSTRIVIVHVLDKTVGLVVDAVREVLRLDSEAVSPPPELVTRVDDATVIRGVGQLGDRLIILLDLNRLLDSEEVALLE